MNKETRPINERMVNIPEFTLGRKYIDLILSGKKTAEGRINSGAFRNFKVGDFIKFFDKRNPEFNIICKILEIKKYPGFREMLIAEGFQNMIPDAKSLDDAVRIYNSIPTYVERSQRNGVIALRIKVFSS